MRRIVCVHARVRLAELRGPGSHSNISFVVETRGPAGASSLTLTHSSLALIADL